MFRIYNRFSEFPVFVPDKFFFFSFYIYLGILRKDQVSIRKVLIGLYNSASTAIQLGQLYLSYLDRDKCTALKNNFQNYD